MLRELQDAVAARLLAMQEAEEGLQTVAITTEIKGSLDSAIARQIAQANVGIVVSTPAWQAGETPDEIAVEVALVLVENTIANQGNLGTRKTATELAEQMFAYLHGWQPDDQSWAALEFRSFSTNAADDAAQVLFHVMLFRTSTYTTIST